MGTKAVRTSEAAIEGSGRDLTGYILIAEEKHCTSYWDVSSPAKLRKVSLYLVKMRNENGWYHHPDEWYKPEEYKLYTEEEIAALPEEFRDDALRRQKIHERKQREYQYDLADHAFLEKALANDDGAAAWYYLLARSEHEYERVILEKLLTGDPND